MSSLLTSNGQNVQKRPGNGLCSYCKAFKGRRALGGRTRTRQGIPLSSNNWNVVRSGNSSTLKPLKVTTFKSPSGGSVYHQSNPKPFPKPILVYPERLGCDPSMIHKFRLPSTLTENCDNPNYSDGRGSAKLGWSYQAPDPSGVFFQCDDDPSLTFSLGDGGRFLGSQLTSIEYPNSGPYSEACPDSGIDPSQWVALFPYQNRRSEQGEFGGYNNKRASSEAPEMHAMMNPMKRSELDLVIGPERHKKRVKELHLFKDGGKTVGGFQKYFNANGGVETDVDLSLHL